MWIAKGALSAKTTWHTWRWTKGLINQPRYSHIFYIWFMTITFLFEIINALFSTLLLLCLNLFICDCCKIKFMPGVPFSFCTYGTDTQTGKTGQDKRLDQIIQIKWRHWTLDFMTFWFMRWRMEKEKEENIWRRKIFVSGDKKWRRKYFVYFAYSESSVHSS